jgi:hypothetical protein
MHACLSMAAEARQAHIKLVSVRFGVCDQRRLNLVHPLRQRLQPCQPRLQHSHFPGIRAVFGVRRRSKGTHGVMRSWDLVSHRSPLQKIARNTQAVSSVRGGRCIATSIGRPSKHACMNRDYNWYDNCTACGQACGLKKLVNTLLGGGCGEVATGVVMGATGMIHACKQKQLL